MASVWVRTRATADGGKRYRVGGRESAIRYGGSFKTATEARERKKWIASELAALRVPAIRQLDAEPAALPTLVEACDRWRASRIDVADGTATLHRVALGRVTPTLGSMRVDDITVADVNSLIAHLARTGRKRETIRKSVKYLAAVLDEHGCDPNPTRSRSIRFPREEPVEIEPPTTEHVEIVYRLLPKPYRLPLLWLDWSGARVHSVETVKVGDYDEQDRRVRLRAATTKTRTPLMVDLPDVLADAIESTLPPREDRDPDAPLFPDIGADRLRTAIARACRAAGIPAFSPHDLRHRRISLLHRQGRHGLRSAASSVSGS